MCRIGSHDAYVAVAIVRAICTHTHLSHFGLYPACGVASVFPASIERTAHVYGPPQRQLCRRSVGLQRRCRKNGYRFGFWSTTPNFRETATKRSPTRPKTPARGTGALPTARTHPGGESCRVTAIATPKQPSCASWRGPVPEWGGAPPPSPGPSRTHHSSAKSVPGATLRLGQ